MGSPFFLGFYLYQNCKEQKKKTGGAGSYQSIWILFYSIQDLIKTAPAEPIKIKQSLAIMIGLVFTKYSFIQR